MITAQEARQLSISRARDYIDAAIRLAAKRGLPFCTIQDEAEREDNPYRLVYFHYDLLEELRASGYSVEFHTPSSGRSYISIDWKEQK